MKKQSYLLMLLTISFLACNTSNDVNQPEPYIEGQPVKLTINLSTSEQSAVSPRNIVGPFWKSGSTQYMYCTWETEPGDKIYIIYNEIATEFEVSTVTGRTATVEGTMPTGWKPGESFNVVAGVNPSVTTAPTNSDVDASYDGIRRGCMRFEGTGTQVTEAIQMTAVWSAMRVGLQFTPTWSSTVTEADKSNVKLVMESVEILDKNKNTLYTYTCKTNGSNNIELKATDGGAVSLILNLTNVVNPGTYDGFIYKVNINKSLSGNSTLKPIDATNSAFGFQFFETPPPASTPTEIGSLSLAANQFLYQDEPANITVEFTKKN